MRATMAIVTGLLVIFVLAIVVSRAKATSPDSDTHFILIGASIGEGWHLADWADRVGLTGAYSAESFAIWQFDKSEAVDEVIMRPARKFSLTRTYLKSLFQPPPRKPDLVILKECSSYFPSDIEADARSVRNWVERLRGNGIQAVLATVVPVTESRSATDLGKQEKLTEFNAWLRTYAQEQQLPVIDLDAAVRMAGPGSYLRNELTSGDGSHLNAAAYELLDGVLVETMCSLRPNARCPTQLRAASVSAGQ